MRSRLSKLASFALISACLAVGVAQAADLDPVGHVFQATDSAATIPSAQRTAARNEYVILQAWETGKLKSLKAADPKVKVLVYKNLGFSAQLPSNHVGPSPSGVDYASAPASWFLEDRSSGQPFTSWGYEWLWAMDIGNADYQRAWADNVIAEMNREGWDGVFLDDANATMKYHHAVDQVAEYPSDATYSAAMGSALAYIGPKIRAAGKLAIPNFAAWVEEPVVYNSWLQYVDGAVDEMFVKWSREAGVGYRDEAQWNLQLTEAKFAADQDKVFIAYTQGAPGETQAARLGFATVLLASEGKASYAFTPEYANETWLAEYDYDLGEPLSEESADANGVHSRPFQRGLVLVNPTGESQQVSFGGVYSGSGLTNATGTTMAPRTGLVLLDPNAPPPPTPQPEPEPEPEPEPGPEPAPTPPPEQLPSNPQRPATPAAPGVQPPAIAGVVAAPAASPVRCGTRPDGKPVRGRGIGHSRLGLADAIAAPRVLRLADLSTSIGATTASRAVAGEQQVAAAPVESRAGLASGSGSCR
ncbi:MAG TPA: putative glycoside hydrolase [Solirubrobacterales bacterium]|jgi:hypothetical protein|nr:putative glycoside hydrolase [Solirubrobacterales bacterium]